MPSLQAPSPITEPAQTLPVDTVADVAVVGGGIAGVAAALAAARQGMQVVLLEKQFGLGGLATLGHVVKYLPLCDGYGKQVMAGLAEELLYRSVVEVTEPLPAAAFVPVPDCWKADGDPAERERKRLMSAFNPYAFQMEMEQMVEDAGVTLMYDTRVCRVLREGARITHLVVENKSGRLAIGAKMFIDASGDADVSFLAGCDVETFPHNVLASWHYEIRKEGVRLVPFSNTYDKEHRGGERAVGPMYSGTDHRDVTRQVLDSRKLLREALERKRSQTPDTFIYPFALPSIPDFRITRRLRNRFSLQEAHRHQWFEDCIGITGDWRRRGPIYPLPLRTIYSDECPNLFVAGRCMSSDQTVTDVTRAIGTCAVTGEASGVAASLLIREGAHDRRDLSVPRLQNELRKVGVLIHRDLVEPHPKAKAALATA